MVDKKKQGRLNRQSGAIWESKVKKDLIKLGWFVSKFQSNVDFDFEHKMKSNLKKIVWDDYLSGKEVPYKLKMISAQTSNKFRRGTLGFPDFISWYNVECRSDAYYIVGVECKSNGKLSKIEQIKCKFLLENNVFSEILIAQKKKEGRKVVPEYIDFREKYLKDKN